MVMGNFTLKMKKKLKQEMSVTEIQNLTDPVGSTGGAFYPRGQHLALLTAL